MSGEKSISLFHDTVPKIKCAFLKSLISLSSLKTPHRELKLPLRLPHIEHEYVECCAALCHNNTLKQRCHKIENYRHFLLFINIMKLKLKL